MRVISASRRTDIPAFYSEWFMNRIRGGYCHWMNPYTSQVFKMSLKPEDVIAIAFWTRNAAPMLPHLDELNERGYRYYFMVTVLGYSRPLESHNPGLDTALRTFQELSKRVGPDRVFWRYDPIVISDVTPPEYHLQRFQTIAQRLKGYTNRCIYSFLDMYGKTSRNLSAINNVNVYTLEDEARYSLVKQMLDIAYMQDMQLQTCCEEDYQAVPELVRGRCVDIDVLRKLTGDSELGLPDRPTRKLCGCVASTDIGMYDTCLFGCRYCYATNSRDNARQRHLQHDPQDSILCRPEHLVGVNLDEEEAVPEPDK